MGVVDWITDKVFNSKNPERIKAPQVNAENYRYGEGNEAQRYSSLASKMASRGGPSVNYAYAGQDRARGLQARQGQQTLAQAMQRRATGETSVSQMQADRQMQQAQASQMAGAASARGPGGMALAQQNAANNIANAQGAISGQAQINAANERMQAEQAAFGAYAAMRGGDMASQQQNAQQEQFRANLALQNRTANDQAMLGMYNLEHAANQAKLGGSMNYEAQRSANILGAGQINAGVGGQNAAMNQQTAMQLAGAVQGGLAAGAGAIGGKAQGGPVAGGTPYIVGEHGPELVVPARDGIVVPHEETKQVLNGGSGLARVMGSPPSGQSGGFAVAGMTPGLGGDAADPLRRRDEETALSARARQALGIELNDREKYDADGATRRIDNEKATKKKDAPAKLSDKMTFKDVMAQGAQRSFDAASKVDTSYRGPTSIAAPNLIPLRAFGGPVQGGAPFIGGELGPELVIPSPQGNGAMKGLSSFMGGVRGGSGPSDGMTMAGAFHDGTSQLGEGGGLSMDAHTRFHNSELRGMSRDPSAGMASGLSRGLRGKMRYGGG